MNQHHHEGVSNVSRHDFNAATTSLGDSISSSVVTSRVDRHVARQRVTVSHRLSTGVQMFVLDVPLDTPRVPRVPLR